MIEVINVGRSYGKKPNNFVALDGVSFKVPDAISLAIVGKSGSGKSTLMHLLGGLDTATSGRIIINQQDLGSLKAEAMDHFRAETLGFVFQSFFIEANQSCYQNVALPLEINGVPLNQRRKRIEQALCEVDLQDKITQKAGNLSGGQKQRLAIARAIVTNPQLILADEPTGNLDSATGDKIIDLLFDTQRANRSTLIIVTHDHQLAGRCDMQVNLSDGKIVSVRLPETKITEPKVSPLKIIAAKINDKVKKVHS